MKAKDAPIMILLGLLFLAFIVGVLTITDSWRVPGISWGYRFGFMGDGLIVKKAFTPHYSWKKSNFYALPDRETSITYIIEREEGSITIMVVREIFPFNLDFISYERFDTNAQGSYVVKLPQSGRYRVDVDFHGFKGKVDIRWDTHPQGTGD